MAEEKFEAVHYVSAPYNNLKFFVELDGKSKQMACENGAFAATTKELYEAVEAERARSVMLGAQLRKVDKAEALAIAEEAKKMLISRNQAQQGPFQSVHAITSEQRGAAIMKEAAANNAADSAAAITKQLGAK